jgi:D-alanyl-D-alanine carboxypeptidase/D-alanyl-D-alanine-endopeptidase (penicillin-binding protein 4)
MVRVWLLLATALLGGCRAFAPPSSSPQARVSELPNPAILPDGQSTLEPPLGEEHAAAAARNAASEGPPEPEVTNAPPPPPPDPDARRAWLKARLDEVASQPGMGGAKVGIFVVDFETGQVLYARNEKLPLNAASNVKLVTSAAALSRLGPEFRWRTICYGPAQVGRPVSPTGDLPGDLYLRGSGDPTLATEDLDAIANSLATQGVKRVRGALVVDASAFEGGSVGPGYDQKTENFAYRAPSSAASLNSNAVLVTVIPGPKPGAPARITIEPPSPYFAVTGRIVTAGLNGPAIPMVETGDLDEQTRITLSGRIRLGSEPRPFLRRVVHPEWYLGQTFREVLKRHGISIDKPLRIGAVPAEGYRTLTSHDSPPLAVVLHDLNKRSSNFAAEQVLRTLGGEVLGRPGSWDKGLEAVAKHLEALGIKRSDYRMNNGAGLYDSNRFTAEQLVTVMRAALRDFRIGSEYLASLAVAGIDGTLGQRMGGTAAHRYVRAKTGTLANVSSLSGVVGAPGEKPLIFSMLVNDVPNPTSARLAQDRAAEAMVYYLDPNAWTSGAHAIDTAPAR